MKPAGPVLTALSAQLRMVAAAEHFKATGKLPAWAKRA